MSWLKEAGIILRDGLEVGSVVFPGLAPIFGIGEKLLTPKSETGATVAAPTSELVSIAQDVVKMETVFATLYPNEKTGAQKVVAIAPLALQTLLASPLAQDKKLADPASAKAAAGQLAGAVAMFLNAFEKA